MRHWHILIYSIRGTIVAGHTMTRSAAANAEAKSLYCHEVSLLEPDSRDKSAKNKVKQFAQENRTAMNHERERELDESHKNELRTRTRAIHSIKFLTTAR